MPTRFLSAEGCYSYEAVKANLRVKIASKQSVGLEVPSSQQVLFVAGAIWSCSGARPRLDLSIPRSLDPSTSGLLLRLLLPLCLCHRR